jgi:hypothetical protein
MSEIATPRTDKAKLRIDCDDSCCEIYTYIKDGESDREYIGDAVSYNEMAKLERELATATAKVKELQGQVEGMRAVINRRHEPTIWEAPSKTYNSAYHGGDCSKHGRYYGTCASCDREMREHYSKQRTLFNYEQRLALEKLACEYTKPKESNETTNRI